MDFHQKRVYRKRLGDYCQAVALDHIPSLATKTQPVVSKAALAENTGAAGGYLIPYELTLGVDEKLAETSVFHRRAWCQPMKTRTLDLPSFDVTAAHAAGISPTLGNLALVWTTTEGSTLTETEPTFANNYLVAKDLEGYAVVSNQLVMDGGEALGSYLEVQFTKAIRFMVERACFVGTGTTQPVGVVNAPGTVQATRNSGGTVGLIDIATMAASLLPASFVNAIWACSPTAFSKIIQLTQSYFINTGIASDEDGLPGYVGTLLTRPLFLTENLPAVGTLGDLVLFDPTVYMLGTRGMEIAASVHPKFTTFQTVYRIWWRGDGQLLAKNTFKLADNSTTVGCAAALK